MATLARGRSSTRDTRCSTRIETNTVISSDSNLSPQFVEILYSALVSAGQSRHVVCIRLLPNIRTFEQTLLLS